MALTARQDALLQQAVLLWIKAQEQAGVPNWATKLVFSTAAQRRAALTPYVQALKTQFQATVTSVPAARTQQDADLQAGIADADAILTELG